MSLGRRILEALAAVAFIMSAFIISAAIVGLWIGLALRFIWVLQ
jgi:hypothetical protein